MASRKDEINKRFKENKVKRVENNVKKYNKKGASKAQENYISGNYKKSVSQTVFGVKKSLAKGETVYGYGDDYVDTKGMKRSRYVKKQNGENPYEATYLYDPSSPKRYVPGGTREDGSTYDGYYTKNRRLTKHEKESYEKTGQLYHKDYKKKDSYSILSSSKKDAKTFKDQFNLGVLDGMQTAFKNQRKGKHLSNVLELGKGVLKDTVVDAGIDTLKGLGAIGGYTTAALAGFMEDSGNVAKAMSDPKRGLKYYTNGKSRIVENIKSNKKALDETGWGEDFSTYLHGASDRGFEQTYKMMKEEGRHKDAEEYKKQYEKDKKKRDTALNVTGFAMDFLAPSTIEDKVTGAAKFMLKNSKKSFTDMVKGTANLATGILPEETAKLMANSKKYAGVGKKTSNLSDDVFYSGQKGTTAIDKRLDNEYLKRIENVKDSIKNNPKTQNLSKYIEKMSLGTSKKYSDELIEYGLDVSNKKANVNLSANKDYNLPSSNYNVKESINATPELKKHNYSTNVPYDDYDKEFYKEVERWQDILDKDPDNRLKNIERMKKYNKAVYDYMQEAVEDSIEPFNAETFLKELKAKNNVGENLTKAIEPTYNKTHYKDNKHWVDIEGNYGNNFDESINNLKNINETYNKFSKDVLESSIENKSLTNVPKDIISSRKAFNNKIDNKSAKNIENYSKMNEELAIDKLINIMEKNKPKRVPNTSARKFEFSKDISSLSQNILDGKFDIDALKEVSKNINLDGVTKAQKIEYINNALFGGKKIITDGASSNSIKGFIKSIEEIDNVKKVIDNYYETGEMLPISLSKETREFLNIPGNKQLKISDTKFAGKNINSPEDIVVALTNSLINKSGSLTDGRYWQKQQLLANKYGYKQLNDVKNEVKAIKATLKKLDKQKVTPGVIKQKQELSLKMKELNTLLDNRKYDWDNVLRNMNEITFDNYISKEYPDIKEKIQFYRTNNLEKTKIENLSNTSKVNKDFSELLDETSLAARDKKMTYADFVKEQYDTMTLKDKSLNPVAWEKEVNKRWNEYKNGFENTFNEVGEHLQNNLTTQQIHKMKHDKTILNHQINNIRKTYDLPKPKLNLKVKLTKGQKLKDLPPVKDNLANLRKTIQKEIRYMFENPDNYNEFKNAFKQVKLDYVNALRSIGVPDNKYFHKVVALQDELKGKMNEILKGGTENTPLLKMELQKLASKVDNTFDELGDEVLDVIDDININKTPLDNITKNADEYVDDFEKVIEQENIKHSEELRRKMEQNKNTPKKRAEINPITEQKIKEYEKRLKLPVAQTLDELEFNIPGVDEDGVIRTLGKVNKSPLDNFKDFFTKKSDDKLPYEDSKAYNAYKSWLNTWKKGVTLYNPGWHVQNFFQNKGQNYLALGSDAFKPQTQAKNVLKQINGEAAKDVNVFDLKNQRYYSGDEIGKLAQKLGVVDGLSDDVKNARGIFKDAENWFDNTKFVKNLEKNEQTARLHHFIEQLKRGKTPEQARDSVNKYLFDYSNKSAFDKVMGDFVDPFWTFHKSNAKLLLGSAFEHPDKLGKIIRGRSGLENGITEEDKQNEGSKYRDYQLPSGTMKDSVNGDTYNYLYNENMMPNIEDALPFSDDALENKLNPLIRLTLQELRGEGNFGNKVVDVKEGEKTGWDEISKEDRFYEILHELNPFMPNLSKTISSHLQRKGKVYDGKQSHEVTKKQIFYDWLNYITGNKGNYYRNLDQ